MQVKLKTRAFTNDSFAANVNHLGMGIADRAIVKSAELVAESGAGRAALSAAGRFAEEALVATGLVAKDSVRAGGRAAEVAVPGMISGSERMPVRMFRVLQEDARGPFSSFNWERGGHLPRLTDRGWQPGKAITHTEIPSEADAGIKRLLDNRAGMGEGIYLSANPVKWLDRPGDRVFEAFLRDSADRGRLRDLVSMTRPERLMDDYLLSDFNATGKVSLVRELSRDEILAYKKALAGGN